jgi:hypothetical protein
MFYVEIVGAKINKIIHNLSNKIVNKSKRLRNR